MNLNTKYRRLLLRHIGLFPVAFIISACSYTEGSEILPDEDNDDGIELKVSGTIARQLQARSFPNDGPVTEGNYYLSYIPATGDEYVTATVTFGNDVNYPEFGTVNTADGTPFKWMSIGGGSVPTFYLDNVAPTGISDPENPNTVVFTDNNPYIAALYDSISGSNDLLWSTLQVNRNTTGTLNFNMHHNMARIMVQVYVDKTYEVDGSLNLEGATVEISNINQTPLSYNRIDGTLALNNDVSALSTLTLVGGTAQWNLEYQRVEIEDNPNMVLYQSHSFIVPPQTLSGDENRPRLTIKLTNGRSYSGILPYAMEIVDDSATGNPYPVTLYFMKEHLLTIRTLITENPPELAFMPVQVVEWVDKGNFTVEARQAGIYNEQEFSSLMSYYGAQNNFQLKRYGSVSGTGASQVWTFQIWSSLTLDYNDISGKMTPATGQGTFNFVFNNYTVYILYNNTSYPASASGLAGVLTGSITSPPFNI